MCEENEIFRSGPSRGHMAPYTFLVATARCCPCCLRVSGFSTFLEMVDTPTGPGKFLHLRYLRITFATWRFSWAYDYFSLASFLDASPSLETFILCISQKEKHDLTFKDPICLRQIPEHRHDKLKNVKITGFSATRSLAELICHIMENTTSLECLTLDTLCTQLRCSDGNIDVCLPLDQDVIKGVHNSLLAIRTYIEGKIPSTVKFNVREPCSRCHGW
ncbi:uncharacterized protein [Oryza sativa Japonica Group]|uniref:Expressed protein n=1 Tax=Oryza sativa subsp. japonica TaxID=39947 RepID=Q10PX1_ORYSJ|nr:uncharacterized protein LOC9271769 isoform X4 [Oryza sativa Japonica Group]ABF94666.1 expressed protein [Oryza sativa Japonica Group]KAB8090829.1 hypothetical protein EE612_016151 [Oryza sativa]BAG93735.1 unnamed protein product [Oryza sativa Japonica Group]BAS82990.1 Os03g0218200 [Oryza sativa Japonica Group]